MKILDRYLFREMLGPFVGGLLTFAVLITGHMLFLAVEILVEHRVSLVDVLRYVGYQLPGATIMAFPVATLLASALAINRLARDHEIEALRAGGASPWRLLWPAIALGLFATACDLYLSAEAAPRARGAAEMLLRNIVLQQKAFVFKPQQFLDTGRGLQLYAHNVVPSENTVEGLWAFYLRADSPPLLLWAPQAYFGQARLALPYPRFYAFTSAGSLTWGQSDSLEIDLTHMSVPPVLRSSELEALTLRELWARWREEKSASASDRRALVEFHSRLALAAACLAFAIFAGPVTWRFGRGQSLVGVLATLLTIFAYYLLMLWLRMLATSGVLSPLLAIWSQNALILAMALFLLAKQR